MISKYHTNLTGFLDDTVSAYPERTAVIDGDRTATFAELRMQAYKLASSVAENLGSKTNRIVAVFLRKGIDSVVGDVGILYSGNAFLNLDIKHPEQRFRNIFASVKPDLVVTSHNLADRIAGAAGQIPLIYIDDIRAAAEIGCARKRELSANREKCLDTDLFCIVNTSGSTGTPKSVALNHRGFIDLVYSEIKAGIIDDTLEIAGSLVPIAFDRHIFELCFMMMRATTLLIIPEHLAAFPAKMLELVERHKATYLFWTPTIMVTIANMDLLSHFALPDVRKIWFAGEVFPTRKFNYWRKRLPDVTFTNLYGPTEISEVCAFYRIEREIRDDEPIPIGSALPNMEILLLDEEGRKVEDGKVGEICVRGIGVAMAYYNNPEKSALAFVQNPLNSSYKETIYRTGDMGAVNARGELVFKGRNDTLIKHMGYRIELAEIENVLMGAIGQIHNCCALYNHQSKKIVLIYEAMEAIDPDELRSKISEVLPRYMVPAIYRYSSRLPRNSNGKLDRACLKNNIDGL